MNVLMNDLKYVTQGPKGNTSMIVFSGKCNEFPTLFFMTRDHGL